MTNTQILNKLKFLQKVKTNKTKFWNITWLQGKFLSYLIEIKQPKTILEIGTSNGFSTLWLALNLHKKSNIHTIEINQERYNIAKTNFKQCNISNIIQYKGDVFNILPTLKLQFDTIFIDAKQEFYLNLINKIEKLNILSSNFTIIIDNITNHNNMDKFTSYMHKNYYCETIHLGGGFLIAKNKKTNTNSKITKTF